MKTRVQEKQQRHAAVRPAVFAGKVWFRARNDELEMRVCIDAEEGRFVTFCDDGTVWVWTLKERFDDAEWDFIFQGWQEAPQ